MSKSIIIPDEAIVSKIYLIRGQKVMLDSDLAEMYGVDTKVFNQAVKRNIERFPDDFMFKLIKSEFESLRSQIVTSKRGGRQYAPKVFTEQGVAMLSSILNSKTAIEVNIRIIRVFTKMREMLLTHKDILLKLEQLEKEVSKHSNEIQTIFSALKQLLSKQALPPKRLGFKPDDLRK